MKSSAAFDEAAGAPGYMIGTPILYWFSVNGTFAFEGLAWFGLRCESLLTL
jgi:hypothetical protein